MNSPWKIIQEEKNLPKLNKPIFIEGLPGIGNVGKIAVDFLIEELGAKKLYSFFSYKFPHSVFVNETNLVEAPRIEMYYKKYTKGNKRDLILLTGDIQPIDEESCYTFCEEIIKIIHHFKCTDVLTTGGIGLSEIPEQPKVYCTSNDAKLYTQYTKKGTGIEKEIFGVVGPIIGVTGVLLGLGKMRSMKGVALLAETFGDPLYLGIKGAQEILRVLETQFHLGIDLNKMSKEIVEVEKELMKKTQEWASEIAQSSAAGAKPKQRDISYIG